MDAILTPRILCDVPHTPTGRRWLVTLALILASFAALPLDVSVVSVFEHKQLPSSLDRQLKDALEICEAFGHGFGVALILTAIVVLDPKTLRYLPWLIAGSFGSGLAANLLKLLVHRTRPRDFDLLAGTVWNTFEKGFSPGVAMQSFPSAHTATAVGLAIMLAAFYPRGRWYFCILASSVGMQRIVSASHFPSDVCAGATVGWLIGNATVFCLTQSFPTSNSERPNRL